MTSASGREGLTFGGSFTYAWAKPSIADADVKARTLLATVQADYPLIRSLSRTRPRHASAWISPTRMSSSTGST